MARDISADLRDLLGPKAPGRGGGGSDPSAAKPALYWFFQVGAVVGLLLWAQTVLEFLLQSSVLDQANPLATFYLMLVGAYMGSKEVTRTSDAPIQPDNRIVTGEFFVILWIATAVVIFIMSRYPPLQHSRTPHDLMLIVSGVLGLFVTGRAARSYLPKGMMGKLGGGAAPSADENAVLDVLKRGPAQGMTSGEVASALGIATSTARDRLNALVRKGKAIKISAGPKDPNTRYKPA